jgi:hypothetical protein
MNKRNLVIAVLLTMTLIVAACQTTDGNTNSTNNTTDLLSEDFVEGISQAPQTNETSTKPKDVDFSKASFRISGVEGDLLKIPIKAVDLDGDSLKYKFEKPFNDQGLWLTQIGDEGEYLIKVTVTDGLVSTSEFVHVQVKRANRAPVIECLNTIKVMETETVTIDCNVFDEEGDSVIVGYDGWMRTSTYKTNYGDAGEYSVIVRARDQLHETNKKITVIVEKKNRAPVISEMKALEVMETSKLTVTPEVYDPDGDAITLFFSEPLAKDGTYSPEFGDRGAYTVVVTASDGKANVTQNVGLVVLKKNRAPVLKPIETIKVMEGEKVMIPVQVYDPDGDDITITYSDWMSSGEYTTSYDDAYPKGCATKGCTATYFVTVKATDGQLEETLKVRVDVTDKNRPPELVWN